MAEPRCPACGSRQVGRVGTSQYYCWECCIEFTLGRRETRLYRVDAEGTLLPFRAPGPPREPHGPGLRPGRDRGPAGPRPRDTGIRREGRDTG